MQKIDVFCHILPERYLRERNARASFGGSQCGRYYQANPALTDLDLRFRVMDRHPDVAQLLTITGPNVESVTEPHDTVELSRIANDELAELVAEYPHRFVGAAACLPMNDVDAALREAERAIDELGFVGVEVFTDINGRPLDRPEFNPLYERMAEYDLPILLHPRHTNTTPDYEGEAASKYLVYTNFAWPYETSKAMGRLAFGGVLERLPTLKIITHHAGGLIPYFSKRVELSWDFNEKLMGYRGDEAQTSKPPIEYYRMFYCDTAIQGNTPALMCAHDFFGADRMLFATDAPYDSRFGELVYEHTISAVEAMPIPDVEKGMIFHGNARRLFRLSE